MPRKKISAGHFEWTPELAYVVGLIVTDGCLSNDGRHITLKSNDLEQIENFKTCLGLKNAIGIVKRKDSKGIGKLHYRVQFGDVQFYRWLESIGLTPAKTYTIPPLPVPNIYFRDFLRGHLDGDGSVTTYIDRYNVFKNHEYQYIRLSITFLSASRSHIEWIHQTVNGLLGIHGDLWCRKSKDKRYVDMWQLKYMKKDSQKLIPWLYYAEDIPCLHRKRKKAEDALATISQVRRKKYTLIV